MSTQEPAAPYARLRESSSEEGTAKRGTGKRIVGGAIAALALAAVGYMCGLSAPLLNLVSLAWGRLRELGAASIPIVAALCWIVTSVAGPTFAVEVAAGAFFQQMWPHDSKGTTIAIVTCCLGTWFGCITAFPLCQKYCKHRVVDIINKNPVWKTVNEIITEEGWKFAFLMRLNPFIPYGFLNYALPMTDISACHNAIAAIGTLPVVCFDVCSAAGLTEIVASATGKRGEGESNNTNDTLIRLVISCILIAVVCVYGKVKYDAKVSKRKAQHYQTP